MSTTTTDPNDPRLTHGSDTQPTPQAPVYLVLSQEERAKGFVRPYRDSYIHVGTQPTYPLRELTQEEHEQYDVYGYVKFEAYPSSDTSAITGRFWTQLQLDTKGCNQVTTMGRDLSETYSRDPYFYGSTYCAHCSMHRPVSEFVWSADNTVVGS